MKLSSQVTHQPMLNSTWASNRATTGAVAALQPLTLERIRPSCFEWRTTLINPGRWLFVCDTKSSSFSFSSSKIKFKSTEFKIDVGRGFCFYIYIYVIQNETKVSNMWATSAYHRLSCPPPLGSISGGQHYSCFTSLITGPERKLQTSPPFTIAGCCNMSSSGHAVKKAGKTILTLKSDFKVYSHYKLLDQIFFDTNVQKKKKSSSPAEIK